MCFVEGLAYFGKQFMLYYGTADSKLALAVSLANVIVKMYIQKNDLMSYDYTAVLVSEAE